jgi:amino acid adenylation domain-containing protein
MQRADIEDVYKLSPLQQGMLFHSLYQTGPDVYVVQFRFTLAGPLSPRALEEAWNRVLALHTALRTSFHWEKLQAPSQVVHRRVKLPVEVHDLRGRREDLDRFLADDRARRFDLTRPPLMRLAVLRTGPEEHVLVWTHHHLLLDGWSVGLVVGQVLALYEAAVRGESREPERSRPFRDYIAWLRSQDLAEAERFWRRELAGFTAPTPLGSPLPLPGRTGYGDRSVRLSRTATAALQALAREHQLTLSAVVQGTWALLLSRGSGEEDVLFGVTVAGRPAELPGVEAMVGLFINTLPARVAVEPDAPLVPWLRHLQERQTAARQYEHSPLVEVQRWSAVPAGTPLFHSLFVFENFPTADERQAALASLEVREIRQAETSNYPLSLAVTPPAGKTAELALRVIWERARFEEPEIVLLQEHLKTLLESFAAGPFRRLSELEMLTAAERHQAAVEWNDTEVPLPAIPSITTGLHRLFERWAERTPDAPALSGGGRTLSYVELDGWADSLAQQLRGQGVGPGSLVGLLAERSPEMIAGLLAILKTGGAYLPLDPTFPKERLAFLLSDSQASPVLAQPAFAGLLPAEIPASVLAGLPSPGERAGGAGRGAGGEGPLAYVMYTSGSTGRPKGVEVRHEGVARLVVPSGRVPFALGPDEVCLQLAPAAFDASTLEIWAALANGGHLVLLPPGPPSLDEIAAVVRRHGVTSLWLTTGLFHQMAERGLDDLSPLRQLLCGGDVLSPAHTEEALRQAPGVRIVAAYGPTENTVFTSCHRLEAPVGTTVPIGRPVPGTRMHLLDARLRPVPAGAPGRLFTGGRGLARGYLRRPDLTAERFLPDPFARLWNEPGARLYDTGDVARQRPDGAFEFLGRTDAQIKIRGFRVEPGEVEAVLSGHPAVRAAAVVVRGDADRRHLAAYVVPAVEISTPVLRAWLEERLPAPMIPAVFFTLDALPLTANGKVDRRSLSARPDPDQSREKEPPAAPRTPSEEMLAGIWSEILGRERIGTGESFFDLGGHSLSAIQAASRIRKAFDVELPLRALFEEPTVAALARRIDVLQQERDERRVPPLVPVPRSGDIPLSFAQQRLWFLDQLDPGSAAYNIPSAVRLTGTLNAAALDAAVSAIVRRHEALRTVFGRGADGDPVQIILPAGPFPLPVVDLSALAAPGEEARRLAVEEARRPFDLAQGPLLRVLRVARGEREHDLLITMHHIVSDGWSMGVLVRELTALYAAFTTGLPSPLPELPVQFGDFAVWQRRWLSGAVLEAELDHWRERLSGAPPALELPTDRPRPAVQTFRGAMVDFVLPRRLLAGLTGFVRQRKATLFMALLAAFATLLARLTGQEDVSMGSPIAGRTDTQTEGLIGFFANTLVLRTRLDAGPGMGDLLARVRDTTLAAYAHQQVPFESLVERLQPERDLGRTPLFQVMLALQNAPPGALQAPGLRLAPLLVDSGTAKFELTLTLAEQGGALQGSAEHNRDLFDGTTIRRLLGQWEVLLDAALEEPERNVFELPLLTAAERQALLVEWNDTGGPSPAGLLPDLFAAQARRNPEAVALVWKEERLTYGELAARVQALADRLRRLGVGPEVRAGVLLERSPDLVVALLAILESGGAYVPLDPAYPRERLAWIAADAAVALVITEEALLPLAGEITAGPVVDVRAGGPEEGPKARASSARGNALGWEGTADNLAYLIYTSGSTGRPKGVAIEHRSAAARVRWAAEAFSPEELAGVLASTSVAFDLSVFEIFVPLCLGGTVYLAENALELPSLPAAGEVTLLNTVPAAAAALAEIPASVRTINLAGEPLHPELAARLYENSRGERVLNLYGPSEDTTYSTWASVSRGAERVTIGRPLPGTRVSLLDRAFQPVPVGVTGELCLAGAGLARGYFGRPDLTAERFVPDPREPGGRLYRTGDLARRLPGGEIDFLGRLDHQVKVRGFRIEPGEIETALESHPAVREAAVVARGEGVGRHLAAFYGADGVDPSALRDWLRERLPEHMVPSLLIPLGALPRTPNGKVDRRALERSDVSEAAAAGQHTPLRTATEELLAGLFADVLSLPLGGVGGEDDFFARGGHSLLATRLLSRVREAWGVELPLRAVFEAPRLAALARRIEALRQTRDEAPEPPLVPVPRTGGLPLSFAQHRLWFLDRLEPGGTAYNMPIALRLHGELETAALESALAALTARHEALRTTFADRSGEPLQRISPAAPGISGMALYRIDLQGLPADRREAEARRLAAEEAAAPFDLARGPLLRSRLLRLAAGDHILLLTIHHIVSDGWSLGVLVRDMLELYRSAVGGTPPALPALPVQPADHAVWQRQWLRGEALDERLSHWRRSLAGAPAVLDLPTDRPRPLLRSSRGAAVPLALSPGLSARISALGRRQGATLHMTWLAALAALLARSGCGFDLPLGTTVANRGRLELEDLIGFFVNTLVLRVDASGDPTAAELLRRARETALTAYAWQDLPFEKLVEELKPERSLAHTPLFQVLLGVQNAPAPPLEPPGLAVTPLPMEAHTARFDLSLTVFDTEPDLSGNLTWSTDLFDATTAQRMLEHLAVLLDAMAGEPALRLSELPLVTTAELAQILAEWSGSPAPVPAGLAGLSVHELFARQAASTPGAPAVRFRDEVLTFRELAGRADLLARRLRRRGVGPEVRVALFLERSPDLLTGVLGILAAGGAFVPLDRATPPRRLELLLEDCGAAAVVTQESLLPHLPAAWQDGRTVCLDREDTLQNGPTPPLPDVLPANLCYVIYTSGSTGRPKGTLIQHASVVNLALALRQTVYAGLPPGLRVALNAPLAFDGSIKQVIQALFGDLLDILPDELRLDPESLPAYLAAHRVDVLDCTPSQLRLFLADDAWPGAEAPLARLLIGGEALDGTTWDRLAADPWTISWNVYGPTECTVDSTVCRIEPGPSSLGPSIGRPIPNAAVRLLDPDLRPVPIGVVGQLHVAGAGLARGYLGRPDLTAERFLPDPFQGEPGARLYATGDLARWLPDGRLEIRGRADLQVKVHGVRIEPGEIEAVLLQHPAVREAAVLAVGEPEDLRLAAWISAPGETSRNDLRAWLRDRLPAPMIPSVFVTSPEPLPRTPSGKVDRLTLAARAPREQASPDFVAPRDPLEEELAALWMDLLRVERVGLHDNFFALGGHSLLATRLTAHIRSKFGVEIPLDEIFENSDLASQAQLILMELLKVSGEDLESLLGEIA